MLLAIDPGNIESGYVFMEGYKPKYYGKLVNEMLLETMYDFIVDKRIDEVVIEMVASYGMGVGKTTFDTCVWIGRFIQILENEEIKYTLMNRQQVKKQLNTTMPKGEKLKKDSDIVNYLHNRFAPNTRNKGKGTKDNQGYFYRFKADIWQAYALGVAYLDRGE